MFDICCMCLVCFLMHAYVHQIFPSACPVAPDGQHLLPVKHWLQQYVLVRAVCFVKEGSSHTLVFWLPEEETPLPAVEPGCGGRVCPESRWNRAELLSRLCPIGGAQACLPLDSRLLACSTPTSDLALRECPSANSAIPILLRDISCRSEPLALFWPLALRARALLLRLYCVCRAMVLLAGQTSSLMLSDDQPHPFNSPDCAHVRRALRTHVTRVRNYLHLRAGYYSER